MSKINNPSQTTNKNGFSSYIWNVDVKGIALPIYIGIILILICIMAIGKLPHTIVGAISVLVILGNFLHYLGNKIPIIRSYLGGGSVFCIFVSAFLATFGVLPSSVVSTTKDFVNNIFNQIVNLALRSIHIWVKFDDTLSSWGMFFFTR